MKLKEFLFTYIFLQIWIVKLHEIIVNVTSLIKSGLGSTFSKEKQSRENTSSKGDILLKIIAFDSSNCFFYKTTSFANILDARGEVQLPEFQKINTILTFIHICSYTD